MARSKVNDTVFEYAGDTFAYSNGVLHLLNSERELECRVDSELAVEMFGGMSKLAQAVMLREAKEIAAERKEEKLARRRFNYKCRQLQAQAAELGLRSWGVLQDSSAKPEDYLALEKVLDEAGCLDSVILPEFDEEVSGWRMRNLLGTQHVAIYPDDVPQMLALSRKDANRLRVVLELGCTALGGWRLAKVNECRSFSVRSLLQASAGESWLKSIAPNVANRCDFKVLRMLGRTEERLRWSLVSELCDPRKRSREAVTLAKLSWATYQAAKVSPAVRFSTFPPVVQWEKLFGVPPQQGLTLSPLDGFKVGVFRKLCRMMKLDPTQQVMGDLGNAQPLFNLVRLFGDEEAIRRFVAARGYKWSAKGLHDAGQFNLASRRGWTPAKWAPLCLRHPEVVQWVSDFRKLEAAGVFPKTLAEFRRERLKLGYPDIRDGFEELAGHCLDNGLTGEDFTTYQDFWSKVNMKPAEFLPHIEVNGPELGLPKGWRFTKLRATDFRGPMLGQLTGCCQHLMGAGRASAEHGVTSPFSAFYVVTHEGKVIAQAWAWLNAVDGLVFDSIESKVRDYNDLKPVFMLFEEASKRVLRAPLGVKGVYVGATSSGITAQYLTYLRSERRLPTAGQHAPVDAAGYYDGLAHIQVEGACPKKARALPKLANYVCTKPDASMDHLFPEFRMIDEFRQQLQQDEASALEWLRERPELAEEWGFPLAEAQAAPELFAAMMEA